MIGISREEAKYLRKHGCGNYIVLSNKQGTAKKKSHMVEENKTTLNLLEEFRNNYMRVVYDSFKDKSKVGENSG